MIFIGGNTPALTLPVTLVNGTVADADQVMADFNAIKNYINAFSNTIHSTTGTPSAQTLIYASTSLPIAVGDAFIYIVGPGLGNTGPVALSVNGTAAKNVTLNRVPLSGGELPEGMVVFVVYDGTEYQVLGASGSSPSVSSGDNVLINSAMEIDQANEGVSQSLSTGNGAFIVDGWGCKFVSGTAAVSAVRSTNAPTGFARSLEVTIGTGAAVGVNDYLIVYQDIEANNVTDWGLGQGAAAVKQLYLSFWAYSSLAPYVMCGALKNSGSSRSYPFNVSISAANTWEYKVVPIPADALGAWTTTGTGIGAILALTLSVGANLQGTANAWGASSTYGTASCTNTLLSTNGAVFATTGVALAKSPTPISLVRRPISEELAICQRYYEKSYNIGTALGTPPGAGLSNVTFAGPIPIGGFAAFKVNKRVAPTLTIYDNAGTAARVSYWTGVAWVDGGAITRATPSQVGLYVQSDIATSQIHNFDFVADARL